MLLVRHTARVDYQWEVFGWLGCFGWIGKCLFYLIEFPSLMGSGTRLMGFGDGCY